MLKWKRAGASAVALLFQNLLRNWTKIFVLVSPKIGNFNDFKTFDKDSSRMTNDISLKFTILIKYEVLHVLDLKYLTLKPF